MAKKKTVKKKPSKKPAKKAPPQREMPTLVVSKKKSARINHGFDILT